MVNTPPFGVKTTPLLRTAALAENPRYIVLPETFVMISPTLVLVAEIAVEELVPTRKLVGAEDEIEPERMFGNLTWVIYTPHRAQSF